MYKVFRVEGGWEVYWCPSAPYHYNDKIPYDGKVYSEKSAAYRRVSQLNKRIKQMEQSTAKKNLTSEAMAS